MGGGRSSGEVEGEMVGLVFRLFSSFFFYLVRIRLIRLKCAF